jgi:tetratricopeptide (TPR) repeat protein
MTRSRGLALVLALVVAGCASSSAFRAGEKAERQREYDRAVIEYSRALKLSPDKAEYKQALERARLRAAEAHAAAARRLSDRGMHKEASDEMRLALDLAPNSPSYLADMRTIEERRQSGGPALSMD